MQASSSTLFGVGNLSHSHTQKHTRALVHINTRTHTHAHDQKASYFFFTHSLYTSHYHRSLPVTAISRSSIMPYYTERHTVSYRNGMHHLISTLQAPETAAKLQPVCRALNIDKDDFTIRRVVAAYDRSGNTSAHTALASAPAESEIATHIHITDTLCYTRTGLISLS